MVYDSWWVRNSEIISAVSNIGTAVGAIMVAITLFVSFYQLRLAREQFRNAALSLRASTAFLIAQEGRNIKFLLRENPNSNAGFAFSFAHTAWYQHDIGALDNEIWSPIDAEICAFLKNVDSEKFFTEERKRMYNSRFVAYIEERRIACAVNS